jgi:hypothetical protein
MKVPTGFICGIQCHNLTPNKLPNKLPLHIVQIQFTTQDPHPSLGYYQVWSPRPKSNAVAKKGFLSLHLQS